jgi:hypothetical protein
LYPKLETTVVDKWVIACLKILVRMQLPKEMFTQAVELVANTKEQKVCATPIRTNHSSHTQMHHTPEGRGPV